MRRQHHSTPLNTTQHHSTPLNTTHKKVFPFLFFVLAHSAIFETKAAMDYNGNPINRGGSITITPNTLPSVLASYTQSINTNGLRDQTFGINGAVTTNLGGTNNYTTSCVLQKSSLLGTPIKEAEIMILLW